MGDGTAKVNRVRGIIYSQATAAFRYPETDGDTWKVESDVQTAILDFPGLVGIVRYPGDPDHRVQDLIHLCGAFKVLGGEFEFIVACCSGELSQELLDMGCRLFAENDGSGRICSGMACGLVEFGKDGFSLKGHDLFDSPLLQDMHDAAMIHAISRLGEPAKRWEYTDAFVRNITLGKVRTQTGESEDKQRIRSFCAGWGPWTWNGSGKQLPDWQTKPSTSAGARGSGPTTWRRTPDR